MEKNYDDRLKELTELFQFEQQDIEEHLLVIEGDIQNMKQSIQQIESAILEIKTILFTNKTNDGKINQTHKNEEIIQIEKEPQFYQTSMF